jgi:GT2 family glycosyltransferase
MDLTFLCVKIILKGIELILSAFSFVCLGFKRDPLRYLSQLFNHTKERPVSTPEVPKKTMKILIIIPYRDQSEYTEKCLGSLERQEFENLMVRVLLVDNLSVLQKTFEFKKRLSQNTQRKNFEVEFLDYNKPFNFSAINNVAIESQSAWEPDCCLFLNNDIELISPTLLAETASFLFSSTSIGAVGCTLLYPDQTIQHLFLCPGIKVVGAHLCRTLDFDSKHEWYSCPREVPAITGALLLIKTDVFKGAQGFDETLAFSCQDLDLCLKISENGGSIWVLPWLSAYHYEGKSRGKKFNFQELDYMDKKWGNKLTSHALVPKSLSKWSEIPIYSFFDIPYPWHFYVRRSAKGRC